MIDKGKGKQDVNPDVYTEMIPGDADHSSLPNSPFNNLNEVDEHAVDREEEKLSILDKKRLNDKG